MFVGELPAHVGDASYRKDRTLYPITLRDNDHTIAAETEIEKVEGE